MKQLLLFLFFLLPAWLFSFTDSCNKAPLPVGFVYIKEIVPEVIIDLKYYSDHNFTGTRVDGYHAPVAILSKEATLALQKANNILRAQGYVIKIHDAYRPQRAVNHFIRWAKDLSDTCKKADFYPEIAKSQIFKLGYLSRRSAHSRGSTIDVTIVDFRTGEEVDMGSPFDFFGPVSAHNTTLITAIQSANRKILKSAMQACGFIPLSKEWWHYRFRNEPFPETYFDFPIE